MKFLKWFLIAVAAIFLLFAVAGFFTPKHFEMQRSAKIDIDTNTLFEYLANFENMKDWSSWAEMDLNTRYDYYGNPGTEGHGYTWKGNNDVGSGTMYYNSMEPGKKLGWNLEFVEPFESTAQGEFVLNASGNQTELIWKFETEYGHFESVLMALMNMEKMLGADFEKGLANLQKLAKEGKIRAADSLPNENFSKLSDLNE
jgi:hypothetical protein